jgi:hypothetical protein
MLVACRRLLARVIMRETEHVAFSTHRAAELCMPRSQDEDEIARPFICDEPSLVVRPNLRLTNTLPAGRIPLSRV